MSGDGSQVHFRFICIAVCPPYPWLPTLSSLVTVVIYRRKKLEISHVGSDPQTCRTRAKMENHSVSPETSRTVVGSARVPLTRDKITSPSVRRVKGGGPHKAEDLGPAIGVSRTCLQRKLLYKCGNMENGGTRGPCFLTPRRVLFPGQHPGSLCPPQMPSGSSETLYHRRVTPLLHSTGQHQPTCQPPPHLHLAGTDLLCPGLSRLIWPSTALCSRQGVLSRGGPS